MSGVVVWLVAVDGLAVRHAIYERHQHDGTGCCQNARFHDFSPILCHIAARKSCNVLKRDKYEAGILSDMAKTRTLSISTARRP